MPRQTTRNATRPVDPIPGAVDTNQDGHRVASAPEVFDTIGAAGYLGVSRQLLELLRVTGGGPRYVKLARLVRYRKAALDDWLVQNERSHTAQGAAR